VQYLTRSAIRRASTI
nr:Chain I, Cardiac phospholamban [synthetic construct]